MRVPQLFIALALFPAAAGAQMPVEPVYSASDTAALALTHVTVIDGRGGPPRRDVTLVIRRGVIQSIDSAPPPAGTREIDLRGHFVLPGFIDMHAHAAYLRCITPGEHRWDRQLSVRMMRLLLAAGITTARSPATPTALGVRLRDGVASGALLGPRFFVAGEAIFDGSWSAAQVRDEVRAQAAAGVDYIKVYAGLGPDAVGAAVAEAHRWGLPVIGHLQRTTWTEGAERGISFITHGANWSPALLPAPARERYERLAREDGMRARIDWMEALDPRAAVIDTMIAALVRHGVSVDPTLVAYDSKFSGPSPRYTANPALARVPELHDDWKRCGAPTRGWSAADFERARAAWPNLLHLTRRLHEGGVMLTTGSDATNGWVIPGESLHQEFELLVEAGIPPAAVLTMATWNGARALGIEEEAGSVEAGKRADLVILRANPLESIANMRSIRFVVLGGRVYRPEDLIAGAMPRR